MNFIKDLINLENKLKRLDIEYQKKINELKSNKLSEKEMSYNVKLLREQYEKDLEELRNRFKEKYP